MLSGPVRNTVRMIPDRCPDAPGLLSGKLRNAVRLRPEHCPDKIGILSESRRNTQAESLRTENAFD